MKECRLCGILMLRDKINDIPGTGTRENKDLRWEHEGWLNSCAIRRCSGKSVKSDQVHLLKELVD